MSNRYNQQVLTPNGLSRRRFVTGAATGFALAALDPFARVMAGETIPTGPKVLSGNQFNLNIGTTEVNYTGNKRIATTINGGIPAPVLRWKEGETVTLNVTNNMAVDSSIHWHGIILPSAMDGVPNISDGFKGIKPGETFKYKFKLVHSGTFWYHSHSRFQEQTGMYGAIVIDPIKPDPHNVDRDYVVQLSDWSDESPEQLYSNLKKLSHTYNANERTAGDLWREIKQRGVKATMANRQMWNDMRMTDRDISDVTGITYTFLMNGQNPDQDWTAMFNRGEKVRLRIINSAAMTFFDFRIPGLKMKVVSADGQNIEPVSVDELRLGVAETYDVIVEPDSDRAYTLFAQAIDRSGYARGTLTPDLALNTEIPKMDSSPILTHADMGMSHNMGKMGEGSCGGKMGKMSEGSCGGKMAEGSCGGKMASMDPSPTTKDGKPAIGSGPAGYGSNQPLEHVANEYGPHVDMRVDSPQYQLSDPGVGLRNNGRRVLLYSDLANLDPTPDPREPEREISLHLTGNMMRYMWSINGQKFADAEPLRFKYGERLRINLINDTMMNHPIHLHGMWSDLETGEPGRIPRKHTVIVQPGAKVSYLVTADAMGGWAYHCHLMYHMLGMFREVIVT